MKSPAETLFIAAVAMIGIGATPPEQAAPASEPSCFDFTTVSSFNTVDGDTIILSLQDGRKFTLELSGPQCSALDAARELAIQSAPIPKICAGAQSRARQIAFRAAEQSEPIKCSITSVSIAGAP